ncbi:MAG: DUF4956 domain-containing protein [Coriobacteriales bacterium]|nr:DUF4956 domain-containing protein [Coriobacteriales bacterium]
MTDIFNTILSSAQGTVSIDIVQFLICVIASLVLGLAAAFIYMYKNRYNKGFVVTIALLPAVVQLVIMLVNGNIGAGLAVMGAFALVRFRSIPGSAKDIAAVFFSMAIGLATGMGFLGVATVFVIVIGLVNILYTRLPLGEKRGCVQQLRITIPETLDYEGVFATVFQKYAQTYELINIKTSNMGSLYKLLYEITLNNGVSNKAFIDELRTRNGNLEIALGRGLTNSPIGEL